MAEEKEVDLFIVALTLIYLSLSQRRMSVGVYQKLWIERALQTSLISVEAVLSQYFKATAGL